MTKAMEGSKMIQVMTVSEMTAVARQITSIRRLCTGCAVIAVLTLAVPACAYEESEPLPNCAEVKDGPQCPVGKTGAVVFFDFQEPGDEQIGCVCGDVTLLQCREEAGQTETGTCAGGTLERLPIVYELIRNPATTICKTIDGKRICRTTSD